MMTNGQAWLGHRNFPPASAIAWASDRQADILYTEILHEIYLYSVVRQFNMQAG